MENTLIHIDIKKTLLSSDGNMTLEVNKDIPAGSFTALFGSSGAGKTTLVRIIAGLTKPDSGLIQFGNEVWFDSKRKINVSTQQRHVGLMFQDYALFPNMTVEQNIQFARVEKDDAFTKTLLDILDLTEFRKYKPQNLSGGQKQRVALARVIARKPRLLLLDEPLSALDSTMRIILQDEIAKVHRMFGSTTLIVSHDLNEVFRLTDNVLCIEKGKIIKEGNPKNVFTNTGMSGNFQITGQIASIEEQDLVNIVTVITGNNNIVKIIAFEDDINQLSSGDHVLILANTFNPIMKKI
jgi:molybdate transport system ATP-binding protein